MRRLGLVLGLALALAACGSSVPAPSDGASPSVPSAEASGACDPTAQPAMLSPDGSPVVLGGETGGISTWIGDDGLTYYLRQVGDCVWITGYLGADQVGARDPILTSFAGRLDPSFVITGEFADLTGVLIRGFDRGPWVYRLAFEDGRLALIEDRTTAGPPGCEGGDGACPEPRTLRRLEDLLVTSEAFDPPFSLVLPPGWSRDGDLFSADEGGFAPIEVHRDPIILAAGCDLQPAPGVGPGAAGIVAALASREGLLVTGPDPISVGGLSGQVFDFELDPEWTGGCPWTFGSPTVPVEGTFDESGANTGFLAVEPGESWRYIVLDAPTGGTVLIWMVASDGGGQAELDATMPVVESIEFEVAG